MIRMKIAKKLCKCFKNLSYARNETKNIEKVKFMLVIKGEI